MGRWCCATASTPGPIPAAFSGVRSPRAADGGEAANVATREAIIEAAARVFRTKGYHAASVQDIADAVGILKGSLYHHFDSKEELLYLIAKEPRARLYKTVAEIVADDAPAGDKLRRAILAHLEAFNEHYPHLFVYLRERDE